MNLLVTLSNPVMPEWLPRKFDQVQSSQLTFKHCFSLLVFTYLSFKNANYRVFCLHERNRQTIIECGIHCVVNKKFTETFLQF